MSKLFVIDVFQQFQDHSWNKKKQSHNYCPNLSTCYHLGDKCDLIDTSSPTESVTPISPRRRTQQLLSSRLAELNEEFFIDTESK